MSSTLRIAPKGDKPSPRITYRSGNQSCAVNDFLKIRRFIKRMIYSLSQNSDAFLNETAT
ncbi:MAG: hypothetical protein WC325_04775 [Candidatus Bathyarchaeia archaeon]|jgi:hypothetical protein